MASGNTAGIALGAAFRAQAGDAPACATLRMRRDEPPHAPTRGFTLVELMVTLAVAAILLAIAVPSFRRVLVSTNLADINNAIAGDLQYARTEAISRQTTVAVAASAGNWQNGWTVKVPPATSTGSTLVLRNHAAVPAQYVVSGAAASVNFGAQGAPAAATCFTVSPAPAGNGQPRYLQVLPAGMLQQTTGGTAPSTPNCPAPSP